MTYATEDAASHGLVGLGLAVALVVWGLPHFAKTSWHEVFEVLQGLRLEAQLDQVARGERPSDVLRLDRLSPLDRSVIATAVKMPSAMWVVRQPMVSMPWLTSGGQIAPPM